MKKFLNAVFLISGTAIGAGVIALPLAAANLSFLQVALFVVLGVFVAYYSSCMALALSRHVGKGTGIAELSRQLAGQGTFALSIAGFYMLSLALLSAYFAGLTDTIRSLLGIPTMYITMLCGLGLAVMLLLNIKVFNNLNAILFLVLIASLAVITFSIADFNVRSSCFGFAMNRGMLCFLPIIFTSFGVQNICAHVCNYLALDMKQIQRAFKVGLIIPAVVYFVWIIAVLTSIHDASFWERLCAQEIGVGELVSFLCANAEFPTMPIIFKVLTFSAMATSAIGIGLGLLGSIRETYIHDKRLALSIVVGIPVLVAIFYPNAFVKILAFGAMIATLFVVFIPYYLLQKIDKKNAYNPKHLLCLFFAIGILVCEFLSW
ncbi:MAG: hypothetical protein LBF72_01900 [Holosporales bacterium]|nr:hypothetical protein [Holosporales bacterium]